jgi:hypothetical protein
MQGWATGGDELRRPRVPHRRALPRQHALQPRRQQRKPLQPRQLRQPRWLDARRQSPRAAGNRRRLLRRDCAATRGVGSRHWLEQLAWGWEQQHCRGGERGCTNSGEGHSPFGEREKEAEENAKAAAEGSDGASEVGTSAVNDLKVQPSV